LTGDVRALGGSGAGNGSWRYRRKGGARSLSFRRPPQRFIYGVVRGKRVRVWVDLGNSPHVALFGEVVDDLRQRGDDVLLTARDHAQTVGLALERWPDVVVVGGPSPTSLGGKAAAVGGRARDLARLLRAERPDAALSHGSYAQALVAARLRIPLVTMMDYEHQPANHLSFRVARRVIVPSVFPTSALRRYGAKEQKVLRYAGFKEQLYLARFRPNAEVLAELGLDREKVIVVMRPAPEGALYHRMANEYFDELLHEVRRRPATQTILLPRSVKDAARYAALAGVIVPRRPIDALSLLGCADLTIGGGGTMTRESALLGTPTYTIFIGRPAAVDAELIRLGLLRDLRTGGRPAFAKREASHRPVPEERRLEVLETIRKALAEVF
jgi:predicted glycosyltransferase